MVSQAELESAYDTAKRIVFCPHNFDSFMFRMYFRKENAEVKEKILEFLKVKLRQKEEALMYVAVKTMIDKQEFNSDYYAALWTNRKQGLRGSYRNVIEKTVAGLMAFLISQDKEKA